MSPASENLNDIEGAANAYANVRKVLAHSPAATQDLWEFLAALATSWKLQRNLGGQAATPRSPCRPDTQFSVGLHSSITGPRMRGCEVSGHLLATSEIHLVGCLARESGMRNDGVVLLDIEFDKLLKGSERIERMQIEPAVLQRPPPGLNQGIEKLTSTWASTRRSCPRPRRLSTS